MSRTLLAATAAAIVAAVAIAAFSQPPMIPSEAELFPERHELADQSDVTAETETELDETRLEVSATEEPDVPIEQSAGGPTAELRGDGILTVEGYDPQQVLYLLQASDMDIELRNDYTTRLESAYGDPDALAAVLTQLRRDLIEG